MAFYYNLKHQRLSSRQAETTTHNNLKTQSNNGHMDQTIANMTCQNQKVHKKKYKHSSYSTIQTHDQGFK